MRIGQIRFFRRALFALLIGLGAYVGYHVWDGLRGRASSTDEVLIEPKSPTSREVELEQLDEDGNTAWTLKAAESVGSTEQAQRFRDVEIRFNAGPDETPVVVTADDCEVGDRNEVFLEGNVVVIDDTTGRLEADTLEFGRFPDRVWSSGPVRYQKNGLRGTAGNMRYVIKRGELDLGNGVDMTLRREGEAPARIISKDARMERNQNWVQYVDNVRLRQTNRLLRAHDLQLYLDAGNQEIQRVEAYERVELRMDVPADDQAGDDGEDDAEDDGPSVAFTSEPGTKQLLTNRLEMLLRPGGEVLERVRALEGGELVLRLPPDETSGYDKRLEGHTLAFDFDEDGQLTTLRGRGGVTLTLSPRPSGDEKVVTARQLESDFDPVTGDLIEARCERSVEFVQGDVRATSEYGVFRAADSRLALTESPRLWDARANLEAMRIHIDIDTGDVEGIDDVRSSSLDASGGARLFPSAETEPVYFVADHLAYDRAQDLAVYTGSARGFQGQNRVEAETIRIHQVQGDLVAEGGVRTVFLQKLVADGPSGNAAPKPTVTRASRLHYVAAREVFEYREEVRMSSEDMTLEGDAIDVTLQPGGDGVSEIYADGDVEIQTADGKAAGENARYLPENDSMTVRGERAWLENAGKLTEGKQLTFFLTDDRILVDGQEQNRTKTTYTSKPRPF